MSPPSTPDPTKTPDPAKTVEHAFFSGIWHAVASAPWWLLAMLACVLVISAVRIVRRVIHPAGRLDPVRRFPRADKAVILQRAGYRCEHHSWLIGRCRRTDHLEADHVHPHSRGGQTSIANGQALCRFHNREKRANVPFNRTLEALSRRRATYFPPGYPTQVVRYAPRGSGC